MELLDFASLDQRVQAMALSLDRRARALSSGSITEEDDVVFARVASSRDSFRELDGLASDRFARALRDWVAWLTLERVTSADLIRAAMARHVPLPNDGVSGASLAELVRAVLSGSERDARIACDRLAKADTTDALDALRRFADRRAEAARLLLEGRDADPDLRRLLSPFEGATALSERVLGSSQRAFEALGGRDSFCETFRAALAVGAGEGWPAKLVPRWISSLFGPELFRGVSIDRITLPPPLGAASFVRAVHRVGRAWAFADRAPSAPFSMARRPHDELASSQGALLALALLEPAFHAKKLGLGRERARLQATEIGRALVGWVRIEAVRVGAWPLLRGSAAARDFEELSERALGRAIPGRLVGLLPFSGPDDAIAVLPFVRAFALRNRFRERFDDDWFDNPRAHDALRHEQHLLVQDRGEVAEEEAFIALEARLADFVNGTP